MDEPCTRVQADINEIISARNATRKNKVQIRTSVMVLESLKNLREGKGASSKEIGKYVRENYKVNLKCYNPLIHKFLIKSVEEGLLEEVSETSTDVIFKIKKEKNGTEEKRKKLQEKLRKIQDKLRGSILEKLRNAKF